MSDKDAYDWTTKSSLSGNTFQRSVSIQPVTAYIPLTFDATALSGSAIRIVFSRTLGTVSSTTSYYTVSGPSSITVTGVSWTSGTNVVTLTTTGAYTSGTYSLSISPSAITDLGGNQVSGTSSGFPAPSSSAFIVGTITPQWNYTDLTMSSNVDVLTLQAADPNFWVFSGGTVPVTCTGVAVQSATVVRLTHTEPHGGDTLSLKMPLSGLQSTVGAQYTGPGTISFTAVGQPPYLVGAQAIDGHSLRIIFQEPVNVSDAQNVNNYTISPSLTVNSVTVMSQTTFVLNTSLQTPSTNYTVTAIAIRDLSNNAIV